MLTRNPDAVQIGLTTTPRQIRAPREAEDVEAGDDRRVTKDNVRYFGEPVYKYDMGQGIADGYLAACEIVRRDIFLDRKPEDERKTGLAGADLVGKAFAVLAVRDDDPWVMIRGEARKSWQGTRANINVSGANTALRATRDRYMTTWWPCLP